MAGCVWRDGNGPVCGKDVLGRGLCKTHYNRVRYHVGAGKRYADWDDAATKLGIPEIAGLGRSRGKGMKRAPSVKKRPGNAGGGVGKDRGGAGVTQLAALAAEIRAEVERLKNGKVGRAKRVLEIFRNARKDLIRARELLRVMGLDDDDVNPVLDFQLPEGK